MDYLLSIRDWVYDLIFPIRCLGCNRFPKTKKDGYLCQHCFVSIPIKRSTECIGCKRPVPFGKTCFFCAAENPLDHLFIVSNYDHPLISKLITYYKYKFIEDIADPLVRLTKKYLKQLSKHKNFSLFESNPLIISVPLSQRRLNWRGFNQSELIAKSIADFFQLRFNPGILHRTKSVTSQVMIADRDKRLQNVKGVFACSNSSLIQNQTIIIIDDICTTGATLNECARILKANGAKNVIGLVIARG